MPTKYRVRGRTSKLLSSFTVFLLDDNLRLTLCLLIFFSPFSSFLLVGLWLSEFSRHFHYVNHYFCVYFCVVHFCVGTFTITCIILFYRVQDLLVYLAVCKRYDRLKEQIFPTKEIIFKRLETGDEAHVEFIRMACARWGPIRLKHIIAWRFVEIYAENIHIFFFSHSLCVCVPFLLFAYSFSFILFSCAYINRIYSSLSFFFIILSYHKVHKKCLQYSCIPVNIFIYSRFHALFQFNFGDVDGETTNSSNKRASFIAIYC